MSKNFDETETRTHFINPFFQALGWDFEQTHLPYGLWDVHQEYSQKDKKRKTKKPDYAFRLDKKVKFFVEAKAPWVHLTDKEPVFQAKSYAFSTNGKAPIVIITDFEEFRVFNALERPILDNPLQGLIKKFDLTYDQYLDQWDQLYEFFSKKGVQEGSLLELKGRVTKNTKTLDKEFLDSLIGWRTDLAMRIAKDNPALSQNELNEVVQRILDRLVFIRNLEDREIESGINLFDLSSEKDEIYPKLIPLFQRLNTDYNGLLFHPHISEKVSVNDKTLKTIIKNLYPPKSPFQFDVIEPEILGRIYEKFLGSKIYLTESHQARVREKPEVVHAKGVYYTPEWVVENIVKDTVGKLIENKTPDQIKKITILDPACGSGSFLLGAFSYLIQYHKDWYAQNSGKNTKDYYKTENGDIILTTEKKGEILKNNIFGVDIDREATEVAILSLYIKIMEEGSDKQGLMFKKDSLLPTMTDNIKCGNSLIDRNALFQNDMFGDADIQPFDWEKEFSDVFQNGGFDAIIGNPPYIRIQELQKWAPKEAEIYKKVYESGKSGNFDIYVLFIEKSLSLLNEIGLFGMILPNKFHTADYGEGIRSIIKGKLSKIVNFGDQQVFDNATTYTNLLFLNKKQNKNFIYKEIQDLDAYLHNNKKSFVEEAKENSSLNSSQWIFFTGKNSKIFSDFEEYKIKLGDISDRIFQGLVTGADNVFILENTPKDGEYFSAETNQIHSLEKELLHPLCKGSVNIKRYHIAGINKSILFPYEIINGKASLIPVKDFKKKYPLSWDYLMLNKKRLESRERGKWKHDKWYAFGRSQNLNEMEQKKILTPSIANNASYTLDLNDYYYFVGSGGGGGGGGYGITLKDNYDYNYILGLLNSRLLDDYLKSYSSKFRGGYFAYNRQYIEKLPIYIPSQDDKEKFNLVTKISDMVRQILDLKRNGRDADASFLEKKIDEMVEILYGVTR